VRKSFRARTFLMMGQESATNSMGQQMELVKDMEMGVWKPDGSPGDLRSPAEGAPGPSSVRPTVLESDLRSIDEDPFSSEAAWDDEVDLEVDHEVSLDRSQEPHQQQLAGPGPVTDDLEGMFDDPADDSSSSRSNKESALAQAVGTRSKQWVHIELEDKVL